MIFPARGFGFSLGGGRILMDETRGTEKFETMVRLRIVRVTRVNEMAIREFRGRAELSSIIALTLSKTVRMHEMRIVSKVRCAPHQTSTEDPQGPKALWGFDSPPRTIQPIQRRLVHLRSCWKGTTLRVSVLAINSAQTLSKLLLRSFLLSRRFCFLTLLPGF
jgi:hypothetical protein